jgi:hypothetical protein
VEKAEGRDQGEQNQKEQEEPDEEDARLFALQLGGWQGLVNIRDATDLAN